MFCPTDSIKFPKTSRWQPSSPSESTKQPPLQAT